MPDIQPEAWPPGQVIARKGLGYSHYHGTRGGYLDLGKCDPKAATTALIDQWIRALAETDPQISILPAAQAGAKDGNRVFEIRVGAARSSPWRVAHTAELGALLDRFFMYARDLSAEAYGV